MSAPFMQLYVADYLGDTRHLTTEQHGAYLLILMTMWRSGGRLPNDARKLARVAGCTASRWGKIQAEVMEFFDVDGDSVTQKRLMLELEIAHEKSIKRAVSGTLGGRAKALKDKRSGLANAMRSPCHSPEPEPEEKTTSSHKARGTKRCPASWAPSEADYEAAPGITRQTAERELEKFRDYTFATAKSDWSATFRNWLRKASESKNNGTAPSPKRDHLERVAAAMGAAFERPAGEHRANPPDTFAERGMPSGGPRLVGHG